MLAKKKTSSISQLCRYPITNNNNTLNTEPKNHLKDLYSFCCILMYMSEYFYILNLPHYFDLVKRDYHFSKYRTSQENHINIFRGTSHIIFKEPKMANKEFSYLIDDTEIYSLSSLWVFAIFFIYSYFSVKQQTYFILYRLIAYFLFFCEVECMAFIEAAWGFSFNGFLHNLRCISHS